MPVETKIKDCLCKPIVGVLTREQSLLPSVLEKFQNIFGKHDIVGKWINFDHTDYYEEEMGGGLYRCFVSFEKLVQQEGAKSFKEFASKVEDEFKTDGKRKVNIDPGIIDANKVLLITGKHGGHKIALLPGVWADFLLWYNKGWTALPWAFPDFRDGSHFDAFLKMRRRFKEQVKDL